jgi:butyryl-CoA dehydrogenase
MLLRQKAIVEGSLALIGLTAKFSDLSEHASDAATKAEAKLLLDLLTPIAKTFPAERGFEANALAVKIHGGYGYSSEYLPEAWLRDQKLNSIHEGTTTIQGLDLLGRKAIAGGGAALLALKQRVDETVARAKAKGVAFGDELTRALEHLVRVTTVLGGRGATGDVLGMLGHSADFLELASVVAVGWAWLEVATHAHGRSDDFSKGLTQAAAYWHVTELPRAAHLAALCESAETSFTALEDTWLDG